MMNKVFLVLMVVMTVMSSCKREYDSPPLKEVPIGSTMSLEDLRNLYSGTPHKFVGDSSVYGIVIADETSGNFYKEVYVSDGNAAINVRLLNSGGIYEGDSIRIYLKGCVLSEFNDVLQLDSVDVDVNIIKQATNKSVTPMLTTIDQITPAMHGHLIRLENVEFATGSQGQTYADAVNQQSVNLDLTDCNGNTVLVRTSGYANFAADVVPSTSGEMLAIVGQFGTDMQLYIRRPAELDFTSPLCGGVPPGTYLDKTFEDQDLTSGGWVTKLVTGTYNWQTSDLGGGTWYASMSNYTGSGNVASEAWFISPAIDLSAAANPELNFESAYSYTGPTLEVMVCSDYDGVSNPATQGTWMPISAVLSSGSFTWTPSGAINLSTYNGSSTFYLAFKYTGTSSSGSTWEVDNINISEN